MRNISEIAKELKTKKLPKNLDVLDYVIGVQLEKIENNKRVKSDGYLSENSEAAMANLINLLKIRNKYHGHLKSVEIVE